MYHAAAISMHAEDYGINSGTLSGPKFGDASPPPLTAIPVLAIVPHTDEPCMEQISTNLLVWRKSARMAARQNKVHMKQPALQLG